MESRRKVTRRGSIRIALFAAPVVLGIRMHPATALAPQAPNIVHVKNFDAKGDGIADDTEAINAAVKEGIKRGSGVIVHLPAGRYRTASGSAKSIVIDGADSLIFEGTPDTVIVSLPVQAPDPIAPVLCLETIGEIK